MKTALHNHIESKFCQLIFDIIKVENFDFSNPYKKFPENMLCTN